jgi:hypothetical protein
VTHEQRFLQFALLVSLLALLALTACDTGTRYQTFTMSEGAGHFSFDYPAGFTVTETKIVDEEPKNTLVKFTGPAPGDKQTQTPGISIAVMERNPFAVNAKAALDLQMNVMGKQREFKLMERNPVKIAGINGEGIMFSYLRGSDETKPGVQVFVRAVYFDARELIWIIYFNPAVKDGKTDKAVYEQVLKTFKVLE